MKRLLWIFLAWGLVAGCGRRQPERFTVEVMNRMTPVKHQGRSQLCWAYAMLAAIETEHLAWGDSVNLSPAYVELMMEREPRAPKSKRGMGMTLVNMIQKYGVVAYDAMRTVETPAPRWVFMLGMEYTPQEFARSVCAPGEYVGLTSVRGRPYGEEVVLDVPDNWEGNRFLNLPPDSLLRLTERAVAEGHGVCWEGDTSERGFSFQRGVARLSLVNGSTTDDHCMAIVGLARDPGGERYFIMKNSWGTQNPYGGLMYLSEGYFLRKTVAVYMTREAALLR